MPYQRGQEFRCPACERDSLVATKSRMDGWTKVGEFFACSLCGHDLGDVPTAGAQPEAPADKCRAGKLADLLGTTVDEKVEVVEDDGVRIFCRDCRHYYTNPFQSRCLLHDRDTGPMDDCPDFERRQDA